MEKLQSAQFCALCGATLVAKMVSKDGSIICVECRAIEDAKSEGQKHILHLVRKLTYLETQVPMVNDREDSEWVQDNIEPVELKLASALRNEYFMDADIATDRSQNRFKFEEWVNWIASGELNNLPKSPKEFYLNKQMKDHIIWLCEDMLELNEACSKEAEQGELDWDKDDIEYERKESNMLIAIEKKVEIVRDNDKITLTFEEAGKLDELNEMDINDARNMRGHHQEALVFQKWLWGDG